ncbi:MAG: beta-propeller fold lactonase family protein [Chloroflexota bacterium]
MARILTRILAFAALAALILSGTAAAPAAAASGSAGNVYTETNATSGNAVVVFARSASGALSWTGSYPTGGLGSGAGLGSQGAVTISDDGSWLYAVNAGSNDVSVFAIDGDGLALTGRAPSAGTQPVSVTTSHGLVYVLNAGTKTISGFSSANGALAPIAGSTRSLLGSGPAQVQFSRSGSVLVVSDKATSTLETFLVGAGGIAGAPTSYPSAGSTPFGFAFGLRDQLFVSEAAGAPAGLSAASSYRLAADGTLTTVTASAPTTQAAACWLVVTGNGRYAFTANAASDSISSFAIDQDGSLTLVAAQAAHNAAAHTTDMALSRNSQFLYALDGGTHAISTFRVSADGHLMRTDGASIPTGAAGLAAR